MLTFLLHHWDAFITTSIGLVACCVVFLRKPDSYQLNPMQVRRMHAARIVAPLVSLFGILWFFHDGTVTPKWRRIWTTDRVACVEFPAVPRISEVTNVSGVSVHLATMTYTCPLKDLSMSLSVFPIAPGQEEMAIHQRIEAFQTTLARQGFSTGEVRRVSLGVTDGYEVEMQKQAQKGLCCMRMAVVGSRFYCAGVTSTGSFHDEAIARHFVESFRIEEQGQ